MNDTSQSTDAKPRPRTAVGEAFTLYQEAVDHCEALYAAHLGEQTDEVVAAEARRDLTARQYLVALAQYGRWLDGRDREADVQQEALDRFRAETQRKRAWWAERTAACAKTLDPERTVMRAGIYKVKLKHTAAVVTGEGFDPKALPPAWRREKPERTQVIPASVELDKNAAKDDLLLGLREGVPPCSGWYEIEHHGRRWVTVATDGAVYLAEREGGESKPVELLGLSIEPEPGKDTLRWVPAPRGVLLERRTHVTVE